MSLLLMIKKLTNFILQKYLRNYPYYTNYSIYGLDCINKILKKHYNILIIDYYMSHMNGVEVANLISKNNKIKRIKIIFFVSFHHTSLSPPYFHSLYYITHLMNCHPYKRII